MEEPFEKELRPERNRGSIVLPDPKAVAHAGVNVKFSRHAGPLKSQVEFRKTLRNVLPIVLAASEKSGRRFLRESHVTRDSGIEQRLERRFRALALNRVCCA